MRTALLLLLLGCTAEAPVEPDPFDPALGDALQHALDEGRLASDAPGAVLAVHVPSLGLWIGGSGYENQEERIDARPDGRYRVGSITKTFVASVVLELRAEGALSLDDPLSDHVPSAPFADQITVEMLLTHTSGLTDYVARLDFLGQPTREWTPEELIALIASEPLRFEPGTAYAYSNAGYVLLGMVVEAATGVPWTTHVRSRLLDPLGLDALSMPSAEPGTDTDVVGYLGGVPATHLYTPFGAWAAGEMVSDASSLITWATALYGGDVLHPDDLADMTRRATLTGGGTISYGYGCQLRRRAGRDTLGHSGSTTGFVAQLHYDAATGVTTALLTNDFTADTFPIDDAVWQVLVDADVFDE